MSEHATTTKPPTTTTHDPRRLPTAYRWGLGVGLVAFVVKVTTMTSHSVNGEIVECSYLDYFGFVAAAVLVGCAVLGIKRSRAMWTSWTSRVVPSTPLVVGATAVLLLLAVVHLLRGLGMIGGAC